MAQSELDEGKEEKKWQERAQVDKNYYKIKKKEKKFNTKQ